MLPISCVLLPAAYFNTIRNVKFSNDWFIKQTSEYIYIYSVYIYVYVRSISRCIGNTSSPLSLHNRPQGISWRVGEREKDIKNDKMQTSDVGTTLIVKKQCEGARHRTDWQQVPTAIQHPWNVIQPANNIGRQLRYILKTNKHTQNIPGFPNSTSFWPPQNSSLKTFKTQYIRTTCDRTHA